MLVPWQELGAGAGGIRTGMEQRLSSLAELGPFSRVDLCSQRISPAPWLAAGSTENGSLEFPDGSLEFVLCWQGSSHCFSLGRVAGSPSALFMALTFCIVSADLRGPSTSLFL